MRLLEASAAASVWIALTLTGGEPLQEKLEELEAALLVEREGGEAYARKDWDLAVERCRKCALLYSQLEEAGGVAGCLYCVGAVELQRGNPEKALPPLLASIELYEKLGNEDASLTTCRLYAGEALLKLNRPEEASHQTEAALSLARSLGLPAQESAALNRLGNIEFQRSDLKRAEVYLTEALAIARRLADKEDLLGLCLHDLGAVYDAQGRPAEARALLEEAVNLAQRLGDRKSEAASLNQLGSVYRALGEYKRALSVLRKAEALYSTSGNLPGLWLARRNLAVLLAASGQVSEAQTLYEQAIDYYRGSGDEKELASSLSSSAVLLQRRAETEESRRRYKEALTIQTRTGDRKGKANTFNNLAALEFSSGTWEEALENFERSLTARKEVGDREGEATALFNTSHVYAELGRLEEALTRLDQARVLAQEAGNPILEAAALRAGAQYLIGVGRPRKALNQAEEALAIVRTIGNPHEESSILKIKGIVHLFLRQPRKAWEALARALELSRQLQSRFDEEELLVLRGLAMIDYDPDEALSRLKESLQLQPSPRVHGSLSFTLLGKTHERLGQVDEAIHAYKQAIEVEEKIIGGIRTDDLLLRLSGLGARERLIELLAEAGRAEEAFHLAERSRARAFLRQVQGGKINVRSGADREIVEEESRLRESLVNLDRQLRDELRKPYSQRDPGAMDVLSREIDERRRRYEVVLIRLKQTNPEYAAMARPSALTLPEVRRLLDGDTALVEYFVLPRTVLIWIADQESHFLAQVPVAGSDLSQRIALFRERIGTRDFDAGLAASLYRDLVAPIASRIRHRNLILVPHGPLHALPFPALLDESGAWLGERYTLSQLPSASALSFLVQKRSPQEGRLLALGDPDGSLPHAAEEAREVAALYGRGPRLGARASESALRKEARPIDILHIAAHAVIDPARPLFSHIGLSPGEGEDGKLEVHEVFDLDLTGTNLVVLSGCRTGLGDLTEGDDLVGWSRAFLYAGSPAVLTTLWPVDDAASTTMMKSFHRSLREGKSAAAALQAARREISGDDRWKQPYYWAAFTLIGDLGTWKAAPP